MRISDWSSDVCSSDLAAPVRPRLSASGPKACGPVSAFLFRCHSSTKPIPHSTCPARANPGLLFARSIHYNIGRRLTHTRCDLRPVSASQENLPAAKHFANRSEEHTSELQSLMRNSYAVFCLKKTKN